MARKKELKFIFADLTVLAFTIIGSIFRFVTSEIGILIRNVKEISRSEHGLIIWSLKAFKEIFDRIEEVTLSIIGDVNDYEDRKKTRSRIYRVSVALFCFLFVAGIIQIIVIRSNLKWLLILIFWAVSIIFYVFSVFVKKSIGKKQKNTSNIIPEIIIRIFEESGARIKMVHYPETPAYPKDQRINVVTKFNDLERFHPEIIREEINIFFKISISKDDWSRFSSIDELIRVVRKVTENNSIFLTK